MKKFIHDEHEQSFYDSYNHFIISSDRKVFAKLASKLYFCEMTKSVPGSIVELGVFKGSGVFGWLKANELISRNSKEVYGFDIFNSSELVDAIKTTDKSIMNDLFHCRNFDEIGYGDVLKELVSNYGFSNFHLVIGNVMKTVEIFLNDNPGFRVSIINMDLDVDEATFYCLNAFYDRLVVGGVMIFDEYAINEWTESDAVDRFIKEKKLTLISTPYFAPSAYLIKSY